MSALCLLSGGLDSSTALALALEQGRGVRALTVDYGQRAARRELSTSRQLARHLGVEHESLKLELYAGRGGALLEASGEVPRPEPEALESGGQALEQSAGAVWVPNRNGVLIQLAAAIAERDGLAEVLVGFNREEAATFPDNGPDFLEATNRALAFSTRTGVKVVSPTLSMDKAEILGHALRLGLGLNQLWACYLGGERPCGRCESCRRLERAARRNGLDPLQPSSS